MRGIGLAQVLATLAAVGLGAYLVAQQRESNVDEAGHAAAIAYAVKFEVIARGVADMVKCREKLPPYATGDGTRVAFADLKALGAVLTVRQLKSVDEASDQLDRLFPLGYSAPLAGTAAAYRAWRTNHVLQTRTYRADGLLRSAIIALGGHEESTNNCYGLEHKAHAAARRAL